MIAQRGGAISVLTAGSMAMLVSAAALAVDLGSVFLNARQLQGAADAAAIAAAQNLDQAHYAAQASVAAALPGEKISVTTETGRYDADPRIAPDARFMKGAPGANAARVRLQRSAPLTFANVFAKSDPSITRNAVAAQAQLASFQIGSRLAGVDGGVANALLSALTGSKVSLTVMDYNALASVNVDLFEYLDALRGKIHLTGASYDTVLATDIETGVALRTIAEIVTGAEKARAADAVMRLADAADHAPTTQLGKVIDAGAYGPQDSASDGSVRRIEISALDLSSAVLEVANNARQVQLDLGAAVPGLADVKAWLAIGERPAASPWLTVTRTGDPTIRTAQMRLYVEAKIGVTGLAGVAQARLPVLLELAAAQAKLADIACGANPRVTLSVSPSVGSLTIADIDKTRLDDFKHPLIQNPAKIVSTLLLNVEGSSTIQLGGETWTNVPFDYAEIKLGRIKSVATHDLAAATLLSLVGTMNLTVQTLGFGVNAGAVTGILKPALVTAAAPLDATLNTMEAILGLRLGEADVRVNGLRCFGAALVG